MFNKISVKIGSLLISLIIVYLLVLNFIITPKITKYLKDIEENTAKVQLDRVASIVESKAQISQNFINQNLQSHKKTINDVTNIVYTILDENYKLYKNGQISKKEAIDISFKTILKIKYGHNLDYVFILDEEGNVLLHPDKRYSNTNIYSKKDINGNLFIKDMIDKSIKDGETFTTYTWHKLNQSNSSEKIVYSKYFKELNFIISSGIYMDDFQEENRIKENTIIKYVRKLLKNIVIGDSGYVFVLDKDFKFVIYPDEKFIGEKITDISIAKLGENLGPKIIEALKENKKLEYNWNSQNDLNSYSYKKVAWVKYNDYFNWYIISSSYEKDLNNKSKKINNIIIQISTLIFIILFSLGIYLTRLFLRPINDLSKNAQKVIEGDFSVRTNVKANDEVGVLSKQFNFMLENIESNIKNLEYQVELRTNELKHKLYHDELTNLRNRNALEDDINNKEYATLIYLDIETFDNINELYGFRIGNSVLQKVSELLLAYATENEYKLYRVYGDIFGLLSINMVFDIHKIQDTIAGINKLFYDNEISIKNSDIDIHITVSMGISICQEEPIKTANIALKTAKNSDRNFYIYNNELDPKEKIQNAIYWKNKIKTAIKEDKVVSFFQPILNRDQEIVKYESLIRLEDIHDGKVVYITPNFFLEIAAKTKQYNKLSVLMVEKALKSLEKTDKMISVNMSFEDVQNQDFITSIDDLLENVDYKLCSRLVFEILESDVIWDYSILENFIDKYRKLGIKIAIDDFGSGYSNFIHILKTSPDYIKIDGSLIKEIDANDESYELVKSIVRFSHVLNIKTIAEYVHSKDVFERVYELGIDEFQGYYFGAPEKEFKD